MRKLLLFICLLITGCESQFAAVENNQCVSYGLNPGTDAYANCRINLYNRRQQEFANFGAQLQQQQMLNQQQQMLNNQRFLSCTTTSLGPNMATTNCY